MNEANGKMQRLKEAKKKDEFLKLIFQYPATDRATIKSGKVLEVFDDCFVFDEVRDGKITWSYQFLTEIKIGEKK